MADNNNKNAPPNPFVIWFPSANRTLSGKYPNKGEGNPTAAQKSLQPGSMKGDQNKVYIYEDKKADDLARFFFKRRRNWFYRVDESMGEIVGAIGYHYAKRRKADKAAGLSKKDTLRHAVKSYAYSLKAKDDPKNQPLLPTSGERQGRPFFKFWESGSQFIELDESMLSASSERLVSDAIKAGKHGNKDAAKRLSKTLQHYGTDPELSRKYIQKAFSPSLSEAALDDVSEVIDEFTNFASQYLDIDQVPFIKYVPEMENKDTFATWSADGITLAYKNRHPMDVFRSLAHELVHHKQHEMDMLHNESGQTGSEHENEANSIAGIIMRDFAKIRPEYFSLHSLNEKSYGSKVSTTKLRTSFKKPKAPKIPAIRHTKTKQPKSSGLGKLVKKLFGSKSKPTRKASSTVKKVKQVAPKPAPAPKKTEQPKAQEPKVDKKINDAILKQSNVLQKIRDIRNRVSPTSTIEINGRPVNRREYYKHLETHHRTKLERMGAQNGMNLDTGRIKAIPYRKVKPTGLGVKPPASAGAQGGPVITTNTPIAKQSSTVKKIKAKKPPALAEVSLRETIGLVSKSEKSGIDYDIIKEVYIRGLNDWNHPKLSREEYAFNRVNSFIAGGKARELDADLWYEEEDENN